MSHCAVNFTVELGGDSCLSKFKWNGGAVMHGRSWNIDLPTDSQVCECALVIIILYICAQPVCLHCLDCHACSLLLLGCQPGPSSTE